MFKKLGTVALVLALTTVVVQAHEEQRDNSWWWDNSWWFDGKMQVPANHKLKEEHFTIENGDVEIPVMVARPANNRKYPAILFQHGRRGLDDLIKQHVRRLAARGFVVYAADVFSGRFIEKFPIEHDYVVEDDVNAALTALLKRKDISSKKACVYSHTRGGYMALKVAVSKKRQNDALACYVSYYPHMQDPNASEAMQVYRYAIEADSLKIPALIFIGDQEQYQRRRGIEMAVQSLQKKGRDARVIVYPGVGRGFDFRPETVRTFADDLAARDALQRASRFMQQHLK